MEATNIMTPDTLKTALEAGKDLTVADDRVFQITVKDKDVEVAVPVALLPTANGGMQSAPLLDLVKSSTAFARERRLLYATGADRREGTADFQSVASLIAHVNRFKDPDSAIWANPTARQIVAIFDYHRQGAAGETRWGRHRGIYKSPVSEAWVAWGGDEGIDLDQDGLIALFDQRDRELTGGKLPDGREAPDPAHLLSTAQKLETFSDNKAKRERDPQTGRLKIAFSTDSGFSGDVTPPPSFLVKIPVFQDEAPQVLEVRLRFTVENAEASFNVQIHAATDVLHAAFKKLVEKVGTDTGLPVFLGTPEG